MIFFKGIKPQQVYIILVLISINVIVFMALMSKMPTNFIVAL